MECGSKPALQPKTTSFSSSPHVAPQHIPRKDQLRLPAQRARLQGVAQFTAQPKNDRRTIILALIKQRVHTGEAQMSAVGDES